MSIFRIRTFATLLFVLAFSAAALAQTMPAGADAALWEKALKIHKKAIVIDMHNDVTSPMVDSDFDLSKDSMGQLQKGGDPMHTDISRWKKGGMTGEFMSIYVSGSTLRSGGAMRRAMDLIDATYREAERNPGELTMCTTADQIRLAKKQGKICLLMGIEGGYAIENSLYALRDFYRLGVRYMTLTHNVSTDWADWHRGKENNGLTDFGKQVVAEMNRLGVMVDISHVSEKVMNDVLDLSKSPIIASHSGARAVNDHTRNVPDSVLKRLAENGGVVNVVFYPSFLDERTNREENERSARLRDQIAQLREKFKDDQPGYVKAVADLEAANPIYIADYKRVVDHIDHIKNVAGIDHIGLGSDFDGVPFLPAGMNGVEDLPVLTYEMLRRGYSEADVKKVLGENMLRVMAANERNARGTRVSGDGSLKKLAPPKLNASN